MDTDAYLVAGLLVLALAIPAIVSAYSDARRPWIGGLMAVAGGGLVAVAAAAHPEGYALADLPHAVARVIARVLP